MRYATCLAALVAATVVVPAVSALQPQVKREPARNVGAVDGGVLYDAYCAVCHGKDGKGKGPAAAALEGPMPDLTTIASRNAGTFPATDVEAHITGKGKPMVAAHGSEEMPIWGPIFKGMSQDASLATLRVSNLVKHVESMQQK
jgi:mono/diheme cytochrome c family protein